MASQEKTSRLDEYNVARVAFRPRDEKKAALAKSKTGRPPYHLTSFRNHAADVLGVPVEELFSVRRPKWRKIRAMIRRDCRNSNAEKIANVQLAKGLHEFRGLRITTITRHTFPPLALGLSGKELAYWINAVVELDGRSRVLFIDPRRAHGLTVKSLPFVFSMMHAAIREGRKEFEDVRFAVIQFGRDIRRGARTVRVRFEPVDFVPVSYEKLKADVQETYAVWAEVLEERAAKKRAA